MPWQGLLLLAVLLGCAPNVNVLGVYFPGWLASVIVGVVLAYGFVIGLGRWPSARKLADSGLFFVALVANFALTIWWVCFRGF
ncbi:MAG: hypothetical protein JRF61_19640 [Deltaproteobacteria bacterium]|nr:hypothetical protein [Deltaproteobacteria bacterium]